MTFSSPSPESTQSLTRIATYASVFTAIFIVIIKLVAWVLTDSLSILASLIDSFLDIITSTLNLFAVRYALQPPDEDHRFGHQKAEDLAALSQALFIAASSLFLVLEAGKRFIAPEQVGNSMIGIIVMIISLAATLALVIFQRYVVRRTKSNIIAADQLHYLGDVLANGAIIISLLLSYFWHAPFIDPLFAVLIACYIFYGAWSIGEKAFHNLMDREFKEEDRESIITIIRTHPDVRGIHALKTRFAGSKPFIQFHLEMDGNISLMKAHRIADEIEAFIMKKFPDAEVLIHQDPYYDEKDMTRIPLNENDVR